MIVTTHVMSYELNWIIQFIIWVMMPCNLQLYSIFSLEVKTKTEGLYKTLVTPYWPILFLYGIITHPNLTAFIDVIRKRISSLSV